MREPSLIGIGCGPDETRPVLGGEQHRERQPGEVDRLRGAARSGQKRVERAVVRQHGGGAGELEIDPNVDPEPTVSHSRTSKEADNWRSLT